MLRIPCSMIEWSGFHAAWSNGTLLNEVYFMHHDWMHWIPAAWMNAVDFLQHGPKHPDWMQWILGSMSQNIPIECSGYHAAWFNEVDSCSMNECSGFFAACPQASRLNAVDSMQRGEMHPDWTQCIQCSVAKWIPIEWSGFYAAWPNWSQLMAVDSMHHGAMDPNWMQWNRSSVIECCVFHAAW